MILLKSFKLPLIDCRSRLKYISLVILHYQVNLQSEFLHGIRANVIRAVNSILRRESRSLKFRVAGAKSNSSHTSRLVNDILWLGT